MRRLALQDPGLRPLLADPRHLYRSEHLTIPAPLIARVDDWVRLQPAQTARVTSRVLFARDRYTCQYCGRIAAPGQAREILTVDHVKPACLFASRQAASTWDNVVAACAACNNRKGRELPMHCGMWPGMYRGVPYVPAEPHMVQLRFAGRLNMPQRLYVQDFYLHTEERHVFL